MSEVETVNSVSVDVPVKRGPGRPKGSKNKKSSQVSMKNDQQIVKYRPNVSNPPLPPTYAEPDAVGADVRAHVSDMSDGYIIVPPHEARTIDCGYDVEVPPDHELQVRARSGLAANYCVTVLNSPGTIDPSYRGPLMVILINHSDASFTVKNGDRIAQLVLAPVVRPKHVVVGELTETARGSNGFGSTGIA